MLKRLCLLNVALHQLIIDNAYPISFALKNSLSFYYAFSQSFFINAQAKYLQAFIDDLENRPNVLEAYDEDIWIYLIDKAVVNRDGSINFNFRNGKTIRLRKNPKYACR